jgi:hypothetical protein
MQENYEALQETQTKKGSSIYIRGNPGYAMNCCSLTEQTRRMGDIFDMAIFGPRWWERLKFFEQVTHIWLHADYPLGQRRFHPRPWKFMFAQGDWRPAT